MNETIKSLLSRRSIRKFKPDAVSKELIAQVAEAGIYAASGMGKQSTAVIAITNKQLRDCISEMNRKIGGWNEGFDPFYGAPVILLVLAKKEIPTYLYDGALTMGNLMNAAYSLGLGSIWIHRAKEEVASDEGKEILRSLGLNADEWVGIAHCALGYADCELPAAPPRKEGRIIWAE